MPTPSPFLPRRCGAATSPSGRTPIYDPTTTRLNPNFNSSSAISASNPQYLRDPFAGNVIPGEPHHELAGAGLLQVRTAAEQGGRDLELPGPRPRFPTASSVTRTNGSSRSTSTSAPRTTFAATVWRQTTPAKFLSILPLQIATETFSAPQNCLGEPGELGPHLQPDPPEPLHLRLPEPQRRVRVSQLHVRG